MARCKAALGAAFESTCVGAPGGRTKQVMPGAVDSTRCVVPLDLDVDRIAVTEYVRQTHGVGGGSELEEGDRGIYPNALRRQGTGAQR
jgi:hypothetical protein